MPLLEDIASHLVSAGLGLVSSDPGQNLWAGKMPTTPHIVTVIYEYSGRPGHHGFGVPGLKYEEPGVQIQTRGAPGVYAEPRNRLESILKKLYLIQGTTISSTKYLMVRPAVGITQFGPPDGQGRLIFTASVLVEKEVSA